ncbi:cytochrome P450 [Pseudonocardia sp. ICBG1293]|uniref:cytochrome P450 family protein n=1 Tax=Pseudonocardia sp. ICBG1293 TaxID=2844382 RepID=UPI001CCC0833|nr:cytochrome P450 [Pseudonocardia sp. ICBG1293]
MDRTTDPAPPRTCPVTAFGRLREQGPVVAMPGTAMGATSLVTRHDDVHALLLDPRFRNDPATVPGAGDVVGSVMTTLGLPPELAHLGRGLLVRDGADHARLRRLVSRAFTVRRVAGLRPRVEELTADLLDDVAAAGADGSPVDLVAAVFHELPIAVICELVGVPVEQRGLWRELAGLLAAPDPARMPAVAHAVVAQVHELVAARRADPRDDLVDALVAVHDDGDRLTTDELDVLLFDMVVAGFETTAHVLSRATLALLTRPDQLAILRAEPWRWPTAVHEIVRTCGAVPVSTPRHASTDVVVGGTPIAAGEAVTAGLVTANFDPRHHDRPDELDVTREPGRGEGHLGFGQGVHYCLGAALARQEIEVALHALVERFPALRLAEPADGPSELGFERLVSFEVRVDAH